MVVEHLWLPSAVERQESSRWRLRREQLRKKYGLALHKSRTRYTHDDDRGGYKVTDASGNVVLGARFDATIEDVEELLRKKANEFRSVYAVDVPAEKMDADTVSVDWEE